MKVTIAAVVIVQVVALATAIEDLVAEIVKTCKVRPTEAEALFAKFEPLFDSPGGLRTPLITRHNDQIKLRKPLPLSDLEIQLLREVIGTFVPAESRPVRIHPSEVIEAILDLDDGDDDGNDLQRNSTEVADDWQECAMDVDSMLRPLGESIKCAIVTTIKVILNRRRLKPKPADMPIQPWALRMLDASFKIPAGLMSGKPHWLGDFEQCNAIDGTYTTLQGEVRPIQGHYCKVNIGPKLDMPNNLTLDFDTIMPLGQLALGICLPKTCATQNITNYINSGGNLMGILDSLYLEIKGVDCGSSHDIRHDTGGIMAVTVMVGIGVLVIAASFYDYFFRKNHIKQLLNKYYIDLAMKVDAAVMAKKDLAVLEKDEGHTGADQMVLSRPRGPSNVTEAQIELAMTDRRPSFAPYLDLSPSLWDRFEVAFVSFSAYNSMKRIFCPRMPTYYFRSCDSIRFLSFCYAMLGMTCVLGVIFTEIFTTGNLLFKFVELKRKFFFQPVINVTLCANSFLVLSGFLVTRKWLRQVKQNEGKVTWRMLASFYLQRYFSLAVPYALVMLFYANLHEYFVTGGPMATDSTGDAVVCKQNGWLNLLMISNLVNADNMCMQYTWYIPMVFQLHLVTPLILIPLVKKFWVACVTLFALYAAHVVATVTYTSELYDRFSFDRWFYGFVMAPWHKAGPYLVGVALGALLWRLRHRKFKLHPVVSLFGWGLSITLICGVAFCTWPMFRVMTLDRWSKVTAVTARTLGHTAWGLGIAWMVFAVETGHGGLLRSFLRWRAFGPLSRMSYMGFLMGAIMIVRNTLVQHSLIQVTLNNMMYYVIGNIFLALIVGLALGLLFQQPFLGIQLALTVRTKRQAFMAATNPLEEMSDGTMDEYTGGAKKEPACYDNTSFRRFTPPPVYKSRTSTIPESRF